ncbi:BsuPI-related putative proteinase inhibitor [Peribacillus kribbensis]|uniref:BsuPI-related putative proteinase inhibitor n=1 Tax=Peribacillus kribbensis TaxID=356658 RepID=UPI0003FB2F13|nr:BsuPI-related putative proteinase inhibitor [Peribacillus kribbensis]
MKNPVMGGILAVVMLLLLGGCGSSEKTPPKAIEGSISREVLNEQALKEQFTFTVRNNTEKSQEAVFPSGKSYDYVLKKEGRKVEQYSENKRFSQSIRHITIKPHKALNYQAVFSDLPKGTYSLEFVWGADRTVRASHTFTVK